MSDSVLNNPSSGLGTGMLVNLISNDVSRFEEFAVMGCYSWEALVEAGVILLVLIYLLNISSAFAGVGSTVLFIPPLIFFAKKFAQYRGQTAGATDKRVRHISEVIDGISSVKSYVWETPFFRLISKLRRQETSFIAQSQVLRAINQGLIFSIPSVSAFSTFSVFWALGGELTIPIVFATLSLLQVLRFTVGRLWTRSIETTSEAMASCKRVDAYLLLVENELKKCTQSVHDRNELVSGMFPRTKRSSSNVVYESIDVTESNAMSESIVEGENNVMLLLILGMSFQYGNSVDMKPVLRDIDFTVEKGELVMVVGPVGCGKSTLLLSILRETTAATKQDGLHITAASQWMRNGIRTAYCAQRPWIMANTVKANIAMAGVQRTENNQAQDGCDCEDCASQSWVGKQFNNELYSQAVESCLIVDDLLSWPAHDETEVGERGISISGGQKARISLARAVYSDSDLFLLDDPLSAVDAHVGAALFTNCIIKALKEKGKGIVLVTHQLQYLEFADKVLVLDKEGHQAFCGRFDELKNEKYSEVVSSIGLVFKSSSVVKSDITPASQSDAVDDVKYDKDLNSSRKDADADTDSSKVVANSEKTTSEKKWQVVVAEDKAVGQIPLSVYVQYFKLGGVFNGCVVLVTLLCSQVLSMVAEYWLKWWATSYYGDQGSSYYVLGFGMLALGCITLGFLRAFLWFRYTLLAASQMHESCLWAVMHSPLQFFVSNPTGRILNRFARDQNQADEQLPVTLFAVLDISLLSCSAILLICIAFPYMVALLPPLGYAFIYLRRKFLRTSRELKRWEAISRSPIYSDFSATLDGLITLRAYKLQDKASRRFQNQVDMNGRAWFSFLLCSRWLGFRLDLESSIVLIFSAYLAVLLRGTVSLGLIGFALVYAMNLAGSLQWAVRQSAEAETQMTSVERINSYAELPPEVGYSSTLAHVQDNGERSASRQNQDIMSSSPNADLDHLILQDLTVTYRQELNPVLQGLSLNIPGGSKVGICGRTGCGKSSLLSTLLRLNIVVSGDILINGKSLLHSFDLETARSLVCIIPQEPHLFSGSIRFNVDPFSVFTDIEIWAALCDAHIDTFVRSIGGLDLGIVEEGGKNLSVGQRQLLSLARAILRRCSLVLMDEVTASIDFETDRLIQKTIRHSAAFAGATVLTVAHRLRTIADSDLIVVLQEGRLVELGKPLDLLGENTSHFYSLAKKSGEFDDLIRIAQQDTCTN
eukprot:CAMPEP_0170058302 /NCGR_PEP_ID=MMETSP0019_2-20121128/977_1 /TAXON_ID=98059 /ORGANISM="Dinobryon sp., Strain UTEXLB2267" /LENGTH=1219 /DNA_ID=CAMNT_0010263211 /DNA_START=4007 /DNA_END=7666 /DNA_ORIENTATION=+